MVKGEEMKEDGVAAVVFLLAGLLFLGGFLYGYTQGKKATNNLQKQAIDHQFAQYNPKTGKFEWVKK